MGRDYRPVRLLTTNRVAVTTDQALVSLEVVLLTGLTMYLPGLLLPLSLDGACPFAARACALRAGVIGCITTPESRAPDYLWSRRAQHWPLALVLGVDRAQPRSTSASCSGYTVRSRSGSPVPCGYVCDETIGRCAFELSTNRFAVTTDRALVSLDVCTTNRV